MEKEPLLVAAPEAAKMLGLTTWRLYELVREGQIPARRIGKRQIRFSPQKLRTWADNAGDSVYNPSPS